MEPKLLNYNRGVVMKKVLFIVLILISSLFGSENESLFWDEVKDTGDIELLKLYKKKYPNGLYDSLADLKIKRLYRANNEDGTTSGVPDWIKGYTNKYTYYGVGKANKHFKGIDYQKSLAKKRANRVIEDKFEDKNLSDEKIEEYTSLIRTEEYIDKRDRVYILLYIDNYDI